MKKAELRKADLYDLLSVIRLVTVLFCVFQWFGQGVSRKVLTHQPIKEVVKLELRKAEHRWVRPMEVEGELSVEEKENKEVFRKFQGILNKLTPQKFKDLAKQALNLPLSNPERLKGCIDKIFTMVEIQVYKCNDTCLCL